MGEARRDGRLDDEPSPYDAHTSPALDAKASAGPPRASLEPGQLLAGRFRIRRFVAQGGMGEVYEAEDTELGEPVALKTVRADLARDERAMQRFRREVQLARKVSHVNVCRTFDVFRHTAAPGTVPEGSTAPPDVTFLTMEPLFGLTLTERLKRTGRMTCEEALPIVQQIAAGLAVAHDAGVVHRDLKTGNVLLVETPKGTRAVLTDFGLAQAVADADPADAPLTDDGHVAGTPAYMAPEQMQGREATPASDVYALGVVLYEMVTGRRPLEGNTPLKTAMRRLHEGPESPKALVRNLDPVWDAVILRCLARDPKDRFGSVLEVPRALLGESVGGQGPRLTRRSARLVAIAFDVLLVVGILVWALRPGSRPDPAGAPGVSSRRSVAVLGFKNLSGRPEAAWMSTALAEMLATELSAGEQLRLVPGESVARTRMELSLPDSESLAPDTLARVRKNLGADVVLLGSYLASGTGGKLRVDLRMQDTATGETVASTTETGDEAELIEFVSRVGTRVRQALGAGAVSAAEAGSLRASLPSSALGARLYAEGLDRLRLFDAVAARDALTKAIEADPDFPLAHSALAQAWAVLGYDGKARDEARKAFDLSGRLPREERLFVEGRHREASREWAKAVDTYRGLHAFFPDNVDYGLRLAAVQTAAGQGEDALKTIASLRSLPRPASDDPRIDLAESETAEALSDFRRTHAAAARASKKGEALGARWVMARARFQEGRGLLRLGDLTKAAEAAQDSKRMFTEVGDRGGAARALLLLGTVVDDQGDLERALKAYEEVLAIGREIGYRYGASAALNSIGLVYSQHGDLKAARARFEEALAIDRETGDRLSAAKRMNNIADALRRSGDLAGARRMATDSLAVRREIGDRLGIANCLRDLGEIQRLAGDLDVAQKHHEESLAVLKAIGNKIYTAETHHALGDVLMARGDLAAARRHYTDSLALRTSIGSESGASDARLALARLDIEEGRPKEAEGAARAAAIAFRRRQRADDAAGADEILARALLAQGKTEDARAALDEAVRQAANTQIFELKTRVAITAARATGRLSTLGSTQLAAEKAGFAGLALETRLAMGDNLPAVEKDARGRGFLLVARQASQASRR